MTRIALCGVYSSPFALRAFVADTCRRGAGRLSCLGGFGAYGAEPEAVWPILRDEGIECIADNHEIAIGSRREDCGCGYSDAADNAFAQIAYDYTLRAPLPPGPARDEALVAALVGLGNTRRLPQHFAPRRAAQDPNYIANQQVKRRAGDGNRTRVASLVSW
jgi:hypothetical protein